VSHITLFEPKSYVNLGNVGLSPINAAEIYSMIRRRELIAGLGAAVWPRLARAQQARMPLIGFLSPGGAQGLQNLEGISRMAAFRAGLDEAGYIDGHNVSIEYGHTEGQSGRLPELAANLVQRKVAAIFANGTPATLAALGATRTIPIIFRIGTNPAAIGIVASLAHPGGNTTGATTLDIELAGKRVELLHEVVPPGAIIALVVNPTNSATATETSEARMAAQVLGRQLVVMDASNFGEVASAFAAIAQQRARGLVLSPNVRFGLERMAALALRNALAVVHSNREFAAAGGLMSYGEDQRGAWRIAGGYVGRILKGEKPADLPVQQATKVELVINMKTAKALGLTMPLPLLVRADEVIE
jgi:putative ABC transport system substrate-binding protein